MSVTATPIYPQTLKTSVVTFVNADSTTAKTLYTAGANGSKIEAIYVTNTDSGSAYSITINVNQSSVNYLLGTVNVPLSSGNTTSAATIDLLSSSGNLGTAFHKDSNGNIYLYLASGTSITVAPTVAVTAAKTLTFIAMGEDF